MCLHHNKKRIFFHQKVFKTRLNALARQHKTPSSQFNSKVATTIQHNMHLSSNIASTWCSFTAPFNSWTHFVRCASQAWRHTGTFTGCEPELCSLLTRYKGEPRWVSRVCIWLCQLRSLCLTILTFYNKTWGLFDTSCTCRLQHPGHVTTHIPRCPAAAQQEGNYHRSEVMPCNITKPIWPELQLFLNSVIPSS